jgi:hypothetical protein
MHNINGPLDPVNYVDVLIVLDVKKILAHFHSLSHNASDPTKLGSFAGETVYMVTSSQNVQANEAGSELNVLANVRETIRFHTVSLTDPKRYNCFIHKTKFTSGGELLDPDDFKLESSKVNEIYPTLNWPGHPGTPEDGVCEIKCVDYNWQTTAKDTTGSATYQIIAAIYKDERREGYVTWDPHFTIIRPKTITSND